MKIILAITLAEPGGAQSFVFGFARWLVAQGHEVLVVAGDGDWLADRCRQTNIPFRRVPTLGRSIKPLGDFQAYHFLKKLFRDWKPDAIHLNSSKMGVVGSLAARSSTLPRVVYRIGGWSFLEPTGAISQWIGRTAEQWSATFKDVIVCVHPGDERIANALGIRPKEEIVTIPNGIDLAAFDARLLDRTRARQTLGVDEPSFVFGTVAHFYPAKNLVAYLSACRRVKDKEPRAKFVLIGDGPERSAIEHERQRLELDASVILVGTRDDAATLLSAFDAFVLPSKKEGMPWALLEAMAAALPCIATDVGASRWMLEDAELLVPPQNSQALATAMLGIIARPDEARRRGALARQIVTQRFPLSKTYEENLRTLTSPV